MDGLACSHTPSSYLQTPADPYLRLNTASTQPRSLVLSIQQPQQPQRPMQLVTISPNTRHSPPRRVNATQGPNTRDYFGHGDVTQAESPYQRDASPYTAIEHSDIVEVPLDPYDNTTGEQQFCGGYGEWGHVISHTERSILPDLKPYPFPDDIKNQADVIYNKMRYQVRRGKIRFQMLFFCVYCSHLELGRDVNPIQLGAQFGLTPGEVQRCDSLFSPLQTGYKPPSKNASPLSYLPDYCREMDLSQENIMEIAANILKKDSTLYQENPQTVAAGLLRYYTVTHGITTDDPLKITRVTSRSNVTIDGMFRRISTIDNS